MTAVNVRPKNRQRGAELRALRQARGWSVKDVARSTGIKENTIRAAETGVTVPTAINALRALYGLSDDAPESGFIPPHPGRPLPSLKRARPRIPIEGEEPESSGEPIMTDGGADKFRAEHDADAAYEQRLAQAMQISETEWGPWEHEHAREIHLFEKKVRAAERGPVPPAPPATAVARPVESRAQQLTRFGLSPRQNPTRPGRWW